MIVSSRLSAAVNQWLSINGCQSVVVIKDYISVVVDQELYLSGRIYLQNIYIFAH